MEKNIEFVGEELFNKIRGRFPEVTLGNEKGLVTSEPKDARFFDFTFEGGGEKANINVALDKDSLNIMYAESFLENVGASTKKSWYGFLKELRQFAKKRLLNFDVRNINKNNLDRRDYKFISQQKFGDTNMTESRLYGTNKNSFQDIGAARINIVHSRPVSHENPSARTQNIKSIHIENAAGERFKYPKMHINGARAMARHISEGGTPYDNFGKHIIGLSEELDQLRKFKMYMGRSNVVAEGMADYIDVVVERIQNIKKTVASIQRENTYVKLRDSYVVEDAVDMPAELEQNWIDQLTVRQFNEELKDVFPYIYKLVGSTDRVQSLGPDQIMSEEDVIESRGKVKSENYSWGKLMTVTDGMRRSFPLHPEHQEMIEALEDGQRKKYKDETGRVMVVKRMGETLQFDKAGGNDPVEVPLSEFQSQPEESFDNWATQTIDSAVETEEGMNKIRGHKRHRIKKINPLADAEKNKQIPVTEYVLSMYDRETGQFPKGETAVLTQVEKEYGEGAVRKANKFIEAINQRFMEWHTRNRPEFIEDNGEAQLDDIVRLSGMG